MNTTFTLAAIQSKHAPAPVSQPILAVCFGQNAEPMSAQDYERELMIQIEGLQLQLQMAIYARTGDAKAREAAQAHELRQRELCLGRSPAASARLEAERGLAHG